MRSILTILFLTVVLTANAKSKIYYSIVKSHWDTTITQDSIYIKGKVKYEKTPAINSFGKIASLDFKVANIVGRSGEYKIKIHRKAKGIYFFQEGYQEVVINLNEYTEANYFEIDIVGEQYFERIQLEKPVVYLYNSIPTETKLSINPKGILAFTYPVYDKFWHIKTHSNGLITDLKTDKKHPYLFWEASKKFLDFKRNNDVIEGYIIATDTAISFLESHLNDLGLNATELTDFITYWGPRLMMKDYAIIQFLVNEDYCDLFGDIHSSTPLDYQQRIGMLFELHSTFPEIQITNPKINPVPKRYGFSLIEWGGAELKPQKLVQ